jgi:hypothetical protein
MSETAWVLEDIKRERHRQRSVEGWTSAHDDTHTGGELAAAAGIYAIVAGYSDKDRERYAPRYAVPQPPPEWPWDKRYWKPKDRRHDLVRAAALLVAEIERLDRAETSELERISTA